MKEVRDSIAQILERTTLASVCRKVDQAKEKAACSKALACNI